MADIDLLNLNSNQGFRILGAAAYNYAGLSVSSAGDINVDLINDVIVGAYEASPSGRISAGIAYVIYGKRSGLTDIDLLSFTSAQGFRILGAAANDNAGFSASSAGDINGDRINDVIVGAYAASPSGKLNAGAAYVIYGKASGLTDIDLRSFNTTQGFRILGAEAGDYTGYSVSSAGDINGDLIDDVIVSACNASPSGRGRAGTAYVIYGKRSGLTDIDLLKFTSAQGFRILGAALLDQTGFSVSSAGDINDDKINDVIVGARHASPSRRPNAGISYVIYGKTSGFTDIDLLSLTAVQGFKILGAISLDYAGSSVSGAGDINGDLIDDVIVGAYHAFPCGRAYVIYGKSSGLTNIDLANFTSVQGFKILGAAAGDGVGTSVNSAGDINGDKINDVIVGAQYASPRDRVTAGAAYVIYGKKGGLNDINLLSLTTAQGFRILGAASDDNTGRSVSSVGDINGDKINDVIVGAPLVSPSGRDRAGAAYVIYGNNTLHAPIGIALSDDKIDLVSLNTSNVSFDYHDNGIKTKTSWVGAKDAFLVYDHNDNKRVDAAKELVLTRWSETATTDFEALKELFDSNKDNKFDVKDTEFNKFYIWQDKNQDGISQSNELTTLLEAGLLQIDFDTEQTILDEFFGKQQDMSIAEVLWENGNQTLAYDLILQTEAQYNII